MYTSIDLHTTVVYTVCMRINISIDENLLKKFDEFCQKYSFTRSELISSLMRDTVFADKIPEGGGPPADRSPKISREVQKVSEAQTVVEPLAEVGQVVSEKAEIPREQIWEDRNFMPVTAQIGFGFCQTHFERKQQKTWFVSAEDGTGKVLTDKKWVCETCLKKMVSGIALNGGRIVQI